MSEKSVTGWMTQDNVAELGFHNIQLCEELTKALADADELKAEVVAANKGAATNAKVNQLLSERVTGLTAENAHLRSQLATAKAALMGIAAACDYAARHAKGLYGFTKYYESHGKIETVTAKAIAAIDAAEKAND